MGVFECSNSEIDNIEIGGGGYFGLPKFFYVECGVYHDARSSNSNNDARAPGYGNRRGGGNRDPTKG